MQITDKILEILNDMSAPQPPLQGLQHAACLQQAQSLQCLEPEPCCGWVRTVMYESAFGANLRLDRQPTPAAILYMADGFTVDLKSGLRKDTVDVEVFFCERCDFAAKGEKVKETMDKVEPIVNEFLSRVFAEKTLEVVGNEIKVTTAYGKFDTTTVGYTVELSLADRRGKCLQPRGCECR